jgi:hypothetical protein
VNDVPEPDFAQESSERLHDLQETGVVPEAVQDVYEARGLPETGEVWEDVHDAHGLPEAAEATDVPNAAGVVPEAEPVVDDVPEATEASCEVSHVTARPEAAATVDDPHDAAAVQEAAEALDEAQNPLGVEPRVSELRRQLTELFGIPADRASHHEDEPASEPEAPIAYHVVKEVASDSARVDGLFESLRASLDGKPAVSDASADAAGILTTAPDAVVVTPLTPEIEFARSAQAEPAARVNKSAVRQEISSLRAVANTYARAIVARQTSEKRARIVWLISAGCMVPLFSGGTYLLTSMPPGVLRWLGWLLLTGGAAAFSVCLNSFNRLSRLHEDSQFSDDSRGQQPHMPNDTAEFDIPGELAPEGNTPVSARSAPATEARQHLRDPEPVEVGAV